MDPSSTGRQHSEACDKSPGGPTVCEGVGVGAMLGEPIPLCTPCSSCSSPATGRTSLPAVYPPCLPGHRGSLTQEPIFLTKKTEEAGLLATSQRALVLCAAITLHIRHSQILPLNGQGASQFLANLTQVTVT